MYVKTWLRIHWQKREDFQEHLTQADPKRTYKDKEYTILRLEAFSYIFSR